MEEGRPPSTAMKFRRTGGLRRERHEREKQENTRRRLSFGIQPTDAAALGSDVENEELDEEEEDEEFCPLSKVFEVVAAIDLERTDQQRIN